MKRRGRTWVTYTVMVGFAIFFLIPLVFMLVSAFKTERAVIDDGSSWRALVPTNPTMHGFRAAVERADVWHLFLNSLIVVVPIVVAGMVVNSLMGYALARMRFRGRGVLVALIVALTIIPFQAVAIPLFYLVSKLGWNNTYYVQILPFIASPFFTYLFYTFFLGMPKELEEAARVDGARPLRTFLEIVAPLAKPAYATCAILSFLFAWGELLWPVLVTQGPDVRTLPLGISEFQGQAPVDWSAIMAFATIMTIPLLIVFVIFQRQFVRGVASSGLKG